MDTKISCPHCRQPLEIPKELFGQTVECPTCHGEMNLPKVGSPTTPKGVSIMRSKEPESVCYKCGQELKEGTKFCTKCGTKHGSNSVETINLTWPIISIVLSAIGIIIFWATKDRYIGHKFLVPMGTMLPLIGIVIALVEQNKQKSLLGFLAGLIPCVYYIAGLLFMMMRNL